MNPEPPQIHTDPRSKPLKIGRISDAEGWARLRPRWDDLLHASKAEAVFLCWDWLDTWLSIYGDGGEWVILTAETPDGTLVGVAPMMIDTGARMPGKWVRKLLLLGQKADTSSEYLDWIVRQGYEEAAHEGFCHYLFSDMADEWDLLQFDAMRETSCTLPFLISAFAKRGVKSNPRRATTAPFVSLPASWEDFLARRSSTSRQRWNKFNREHNVVIRIAGKDLSVAEGMSIIRSLNEIRWGGARQSFLSERYIRFHDQIAERFQKNGRLMLLFLEVDGRVIAGRYDFAYGGKGWCFQGGWQPDLGKLRPGRMMMTAMMRHCISLGLREYDFLGGEASYKNEWSDGSRDIVSLHARNPASLRVRLYEIAVRARSFLRSFLEKPELRSNATSAASS